MVTDAIEYCVKNEKLVAAICAAPMILGDLGYLDGKNAVCFPVSYTHLKPCWSAVFLAPVAQ